MIIISRCPYRISLLGGSSDLDWFVKKEEFGTCLGYSLDKYSYSVLNVLPSFSNKGILEYSNREEYKNLNWQKIEKSMRSPSWVFDARLIAQADQIKKAGLNLWSIGNGSSN